MCERMTEFLEHNIFCRGRYIYIEENKIFLVLAIISLIQIPKMYFIIFNRIVAWVNQEEKWLYLNTNGELERNRIFFITVRNIRHFKANFGSYPAKIQICHKCWKSFRVVSIHAVSICQLSVLGIVY